MHARRTSLFGAAVFWTGAALAQGPALPPPDGLDTSWNNAGTLAVALPGQPIVNPVAMAVQPDGRLVLAAMCGGSGWESPCLARLLPGGGLDAGFGPNHTGSLVLSAFPSYSSADEQYSMLTPRGLLRQADGKLVVAGRAVGGGTNGARAMVGRLLADGTLDPAVAQPVKIEFAHNADTPVSMINAVAQQADGKLIVAGWTYRPDPSPPSGTPNTDFGIARLRTDLSLDPTFNGTGKQTVAFDLGGHNHAEVNAIAIQSDGRIVVAGYADSASNGRDVAVARLNANGTLDGSFGSGGRASFDFGHHLDDVANAVRIDAAGRVLIAGSRRYSDNNNDDDFLVARIRADGSALDASFCNGGYTTANFDLGTDNRQDIADEFLIQSDGKIVLVGTAASDAGNRFAVARLRSDCNADTSFGSGGLLSGAFANGHHNQAHAAAFGGSGIVLAGYVDTQFGVAQLRIDLIFANGFDAP